MSAASESIAAAKQVTRSARCALCEVMAVKTASAIISKLADIPIARQIRRERHRESDHQDTFSLERECPECVGMDPVAI